MRWLGVLLVVAALSAVAVVATQRLWRREARDRAALPGFVAKLGLTFNGSSTELDAASRSSLYVAHVRSEDFFEADDTEGQISGTYREATILGSIYWCDIDGVQGSVVILSTPMPPEIDTAFVVSHPTQLRGLASLATVPISDAHFASTVAVRAGNVERVSANLDPTFRRFILSRGRWAKGAGAASPHWFEVQSGYATVSCSLPGSTSEFRRQLHTLIEFNEHVLRRRG